MRRLPPLGAVRAFEAAARLGSFKRAADELGVTPTAISQQIRQIEAHLGAALFVRLTRKVALTEAGRALYPELREALDRIAAAAEAVRRPAVRRVATLSATVAFTAKMLAPHVASFRTQNPGWDLRLHASDEPVDLQAGEADAAIRYGRGRYPGLVAQPLMTDAFTPVCSPRLGPVAPDDLGRIGLIHFEFGPHAAASDAPSWRAWAGKAALPGLDVAAGIVFTDESAAIDAAVAGQGVALLSVALVASELASGALVAPFGPILTGLRFDFVHPAGAGDRPAVAALGSWVRARFGGGEATGVEGGRAGFGRLLGGGRDRGGAGRRRRREFALRTG